VELLLGGDPAPETVRRRKQKRKPKLEAVVVDPSPPRNGHGDRKMASASPRSGDTEPPRSEDLGETKEMVCPLSSTQSYTPITT